MSDQERKSQTPADGEELSEQALESVAGGAQTPTFPPVTIDPIMGPVSPEPFIPIVDPDVQL